MGEAQSTAWLGNRRVGGRVPRTDGEGRGRGLGAAGLRLRLPWSSHLVIHLLGWFADIQQGLEPRL